MQLVLPFLKNDAKVAQEDVDALRHVFEQVGHRSRFECIADPVLLLAHSERSVTGELNLADAEIGSTEIHRKEGSLYSPIWKSSDCHHIPISWSAS